MDYYLQLFTAPAAEPITIAEARQQVRLTEGEARFDLELAILISAAREWAESLISRCFIEQTWDMLFAHGFPSTPFHYVLSSDEIRIPRAPLKATAGITHVKYLDTAGTQQTLVENTGYNVISRGGRAVIVPVYGTSWPSVRDWTNAGGQYPLEVRFIAGYGTAPSKVPARFRNAMLLHIEAGFDRDPDTKELLMERAESLLLQDRFIPR